MRYPLSNAAPMLSLLAPCAAHAQENTPEPILRVTLDPPCVVVRQAATLRIEVLAPNYMMAPPKLVDFQLRNALMRQLRSPNESEERDGLTYGGVRFAFAIHPQESGNYAISRLTIVIKYAADPPATREATFTLPRIAFQPFIPHVASDMQPFPAACSLSITQTINRSSDQLETRNAVTRTVTIEDRGHSDDAVVAGEICCPRRAQALPRSIVASDVGAQRIDVTHFDAVTCMSRQTRQRAAHAGRDAYCATCSRATGCNGSNRSRHACDRGIAARCPRSCTRRRDQRGRARALPRQPFKAILEKDSGALAASGEKGLVQINGGAVCRHDHRCVRKLSARLARTAQLRCQFGGYDGKIQNCLPITKVWNYTIRLYRATVAIARGKAGGLNTQGGDAK
ncbi:hypothetical protein [Bradyrhizobium sp. Mp64]|uniref:hypothetical protein n=1 Tax=Bradyrhizobium sp. Mp64 TaxID=3042158 RepID=UPI00248B72CC|nr:hypothetical protein [Bradyrhizobium sp. Mp64]MDI2111490.1 hypothetical protein [Bradyrhizobium sp. Mp64]